jgi:hypothetical protein
MRTHLTFVLSLFLLACSSEGSDTDTSSVNPSTGGSGGAGGSAAGSGGSSGSSGGSSSGSGGSDAGQGGASGSGAGQGGGPSGSGGTSGGSAGDGGAGGSAAGNGGAGTGGAAGEGGGAGGAGPGGTAGAGGGENCCATVKCGGTNPICVEGECFDLKKGECFSDEDCGGKKCNGVIVCPCNADCDAPTTPGKCEGTATKDWDKCGAPGDCTLQAKGCCAPCGMPGIDDVDAVNQSKIDEHQKDVCGEELPVCPACATMPNPDLLAACALGQGKCVALEVSKSSFAACTKDEDCMLRAATCCGCGPYDKEQLLALNKGQNAAYASELGCDLVNCAPCENPEFPEGVKAVCDPQTKHCRVSP